MSSLSPRPAHMLMNKGIIATSVVALVVLAKIVTLWFTVAVFREGRWDSGFVCLFVCLSVCLSVSVTLGKWEGVVGLVKIK